MNLNSKHKLITIFLIFLSFVSTILAEESIDQLIQQLGAESFEKRQEASKKLWEMGSKAIEKLKDAANSNDPEIKDRASELIDKITLGITPDTPQEMLKTIRDFLNSDDEKKGEILIGLTIQPGGWETIRSLVYLKMSEEHSSLVLTRIDSNSILTMRDSGRVKDAGAILELAAVFSGEFSWINNYLAYIYETKSHKEAAARLLAVLPKIEEDKFERKAFVHFTLALIYRSAEDFEKAALQSREVYKLAFKHSLDEMKMKCKDLFVDTHMMAGKYGYLEKFWEKTSFEISKKERLWNMIFLQRLQGKSEDFEKSIMELTKLMDNEEDYSALARLLILNGEKKKAETLLEKHKDYQTLAMIALGEMNISQQVEWLKKSDEKEAKMELLAIMAESAGKKDVKDEMIKYVKDALKVSDSVTAALYLMDAGFKTEAVKFLKDILKDPELEESDAYRAAWGLCENQSLAELFLLVRFKTRNKNIAEAVDYVHLLSFTEDENSFAGYLDLLQEKFIGYNREMSRIIEKLAVYCLEKKWYQNAAAVTNLLPSGQRGLFNSILESEALVRKGDYLKAAHNLLAAPSGIKLSLPYYIIAEAYRKSNDSDKQGKAAAMASYYDMAREDIMSLTSGYLYENGYYEYFLVAADKQANVSSSLSVQRLQATKMISDSHVHNLMHDKAHKFFMQYYLLSSTKPEYLASANECLRLAYQYNEFKLREAISENNKENIDKFFKKCTALNQNNIEVPILLKSSENAYANTLFEAAFNQQWENMQADIKKFPTHAMLLNSAAWLGAICDHDLKRCLEMAEKSVKLDPGAANLDTLAEVHFRLKNYKEAVMYIEKAANLETTEPFFKDRVEKFKKAAAKSK